MSSKPEEKALGMKDDSHLSQYFGLSKCITLSDVDASLGLIYHNLYF